LVSTKFLAELRHRYILLIILCLFQPVFGPGVAIFGSKNLAFLISRGNIPESVCKIVFRKSEQESVKISTLDTFLAEILDWWTLLVHDCSIEELDGET